ncbi:MAG: hypothetical protein L0K07_08240 [Yaniella sp.]|uniref:PrpF domain-containing protein n=1 Tax=Yaniella sp. TaxID=2773929 RepID=UPI002649ADD9|nr:PrpF domain-containing protein [Yaniella sp.]MDN5816289.1 hypothetical protein [Yaniella sp.]MDN5819011.1 hypothetical protein [Yaniella sp.]MDN6172041.1 hypothetical protein [Yaniella sp.]MDN6411350.1 hypothetical protein [Yaniella sp.]
MSTNQRSIPATYMRGGTSKGVFFHSRDLPPAGDERDELLLRIMGSPDPLQIDGMGGTYSSSSKVVVVDGTHNNAVTYWFGQVSIARASIDWNGNCGNLTTAVGPFALEEGLVPSHEPVTTLTLHNGNTATTIETSVPIHNGTFKVDGDHVVDGVPGSGAPVVTRYLDPAGKTTGHLLPTGRSVTEVYLPSGQLLQVSVVDAASVFAFIQASELGVDLERDTASLNAEHAVLELIEYVRSQLAVQLDRVEEPALAATQSATVPRIMLFEPGTGKTTVNARAVMMGQFHRALPMTGALCLAAAVHTPGTLVHTRLQQPASPEVIIGHPKGQAVVEVAAEQRDNCVLIHSLGVTRTARRIMDGNVYVPT